VVPVPFTARSLCPFIQSQLSCVFVYLRPYTGKYLHNKQHGTYTCVVCGARLFSSDQKFESGCGWPAFSQVLSTAAVNLVADYSYGLLSTFAIIFHAAFCDLTGFTVRNTKPHYAVGIGVPTSKEKYPVPRVSDGTCR